MRVFMLDTAAREQIVLCDQGLDDSIVRPALAALGVNDKFALKAGGVLGVGTVVGDGERDGRVDAARFEFAAVRHPDFKVVAAMAWGGVDEACACVVGDVVAIKERDGEAILSLTRLAARGTLSPGGRGERARLFSLLPHGEKVARRAG